MCHRRRKLNVRHALTTNLGQRNFNATLFTDNTAMLKALVLTAQALVVLNRTKHSGTKQSVPFRFERTIVDRFGLFHFPKRPGPDHVRRGKADPQRIEFLGLAFLSFQQVE